MAGYLVKHLWAKGESFSWGMVGAASFAGLTAFIQGLALFHIDLKFKDLGRILWDIRT